MGSSQTLRSMNVGLNGDNQVDALRPVALPSALSGGLFSQSAAGEMRSNVTSRWLKGNKKGKAGGFPALTLSALSWLPTSFRSALSSASRKPLRWSAGHEACFSC